MLAVQTDQQSDSTMNTVAFLLETQDKCLGKLLRAEGAPNDPLWERNDAECDDQNLSASKTTIALHQFDQWSRQAGKPRNPLILVRRHHEKSRYGDDQH